MNEKQVTNEENKNFTRKDKANDQDVQSSGQESGTLPFFQQQIGNRAVQRLLAQRSGDGPFDLDDETADRINRERGGGQSLDSNSTNQDERCHRPGFQRCKGPHGTRVSRAQ